MNQDEIRKPVASAVGAGKPTREYAIEGEVPFYQVSPEASIWTKEPSLEVVRVQEIEDDLRARGELKPYPLPGSSEYECEIQDLRDRYDERYKPFNQSDKGELSILLRHPVFIARPPAGTVVNNRVRTGRLPIVLNGAELATMFEAEKTAVWHQHVVLTLLDLPGRLRDEQYDAMPAACRGRLFKLREVISPVRQALMQAALHMATFSALCAVWRFKWRTTTPEYPVERRPRPKEVLEELPVLFDSEIRFSADGDILRDLEVLKPCPTMLPGSPRHPAYGSGHSTYSKAASDVLKAFLPDEWGDPEDETQMVRGIHHGLDVLAENIGQARIWGGVHWQSDHCFGQDIGAAIGRQIFQQLDRSLIHRMGDPNYPDWIAVPTREELEDRLENPLPKEQWGAPAELDDFKNLKGQAG